jgi:glycosidase
VAKGSASRYCSWFHIHDFPLFPGGRDSGDTRESNFEGFAFTTKMPKLNTANPETRAYLFEVAERYVREFGIDGWRLDVSNEIDHAFWREFRSRLKAIDPDVYIVGEIWHDAMPWLRGDQYDAVMNYPFGAAIADFLLARPWMASGKDLVQRIAAIDFTYPKPVVRSAFNLLDSHDTERIRTKFGSIGRVRQALSLLFSLPGAPCVYYGTEYALEGGGDPDNRRCMPWDPEPEEQAFADFLRSLITVRRAWWKVVADGERFSAYLDGYPGFAAMGATLDGSAIVTLVNRDDTAVPERAWRSALRLADGATVMDVLAKTEFSGELGARGMVVVSTGKNAPDSTR